MHSPLQQIPTHIITGFLGVGKTTAIRSLLQRKPEQERWAVLVNEFGEIGIDGLLLEGATTDSTGVFIRELPGGCLCCAANVPMQVALNQLLKEAKPDRLLIEPTGLGHPREIITALCKPDYRTVLDLRATLTLVDARKVADCRYIEHDTFNQQLKVADLIIANKTDLYQADSMTRLTAYLHQIGSASTPIQSTTQGAIDQDWLELPRFTMVADLPSQTSEPFQRCSWQFDPQTLFEYQAITDLFTQFSGMRLKAVVQTEQGAIAFNKVEGSATQSTLKMAQGSRIELIDPNKQVWAQFEIQLHRAIINTTKRETRTG